MVKFSRKFDPGALRLLIFDLDGTLIDSRLDLIHSINAMLRNFGRPELPGDVVASYVGDGAPMLVRRALGDPKDETFFKEALDYFLAYYRVHKLDHTHVYDGIKEALRAIAHSTKPAGNGHPKAGPNKSSAHKTDLPKHSSSRNSRSMAVLSNKPVHPSRAIVEALGLSEFFTVVYGGNSFKTKKPDPLGALALLKENGVAPEETVIIGDSSIDVLTGRNAGLWTCGVTYGFAPHTLAIAPPDVTIDHPDELAELFT